MIHLHPSAGVPSLIQAPLPIKIEKNCTNDVISKKN